MINFFNDLILPVQNRLNAFLAETTENGSFVYGVNDVPKNFRYLFTFAADTAEYEHAYKEQDGLHQNGVIPINGLADVNPVSLDGITSTTYNALVDASVAIILPLNRTRGTVAKAFVGDFRRLVDDALQSSSSSYVVDGATIYQVNTRYSLLQTGDRSIRSGAGESIEFTLYLSFSIVASGISSDSIELYVDGERIYGQRTGIARKSVKELGIPAGGNSQKGYESGTLLSITFDLPARFTNNAGSSLSAKSFNEKVAAFTLTGVNETFSVTVSYPTNQTVAGGKVSVTNTTATYSMKFDSVGINGETGLAASHSITLMEV